MTNQSRQAGRQAAADLSHSIFTPVISRRRRSWEAKRFRGRVTGCQQKALTRLNQAGDTSWRCVKKYPKLKPPQLLRMCVFTGGKNMKTLQCYLFFHERKERKQKGRTNLFSRSWTQYFFLSKPSWSTIR